MKKISTQWIQRKAVEDYFEFDDILEKLKCINGVKDIKEWLKPTKKSLHDPYLLKNNEEVAIKIVKAIQSNKNICVSYDPDGK